MTDTKDIVHVTIAAAPGSVVVTLANMFDPEDNTLDEIPIIAWVVERFEQPDAFGDGKPRVWHELNKPVTLVPVFEQHWAVKHSDGKFYFPNDGKFPEDFPPIYESEAGVAERLRARIEDHPEWTLPPLPPRRETIRINVTPRQIEQHDE